MGQNENQIIKIAHQAYDLAKEAGLISKGFKEVFSQETLAEIAVEAKSLEKGLERSLGRTGMAKFERGFENGRVGLREDLVTPLISDKLYEPILDNKRMVSVDWKWGSDDIIWNAQQAIPGLPIEFVDEIFDGDHRTSTVKVRGKEVILTEDYPWELMCIINDLLDDSIFLYYDTGGDDYEFLLVKKEAVSEILDSPFFKVRYI